jgi:hypothetical protein
MRLVTSAGVTSEGVPSSSRQGFVDDKKSGRRAVADGDRWRLVLSKDGVDTLDKLLCEELVRTGGKRYALTRNPLC